MMRSLWTAASGMRAQQLNVDTIANNISNVNTTAYKTQEASFKTLLYQNLQSTSTNNAGENKPVPAEVGLGTRLSAITSQFDQGNLNASSRPFDVAIEGEGFFQVKNEAGEILYTRDGTFNVSPVQGGNLLCTAAGLPVLDQNGNQIVLPDKYNASDVQIDKNGYIGFPDAKGNFAPLMNNGYQVKLGLYQFSNPAGLHKAGNNTFAVTAASGEAMAEFGNLNLTPSMTHQFYTEGSNVDVANEMVNLIVAQRAYEMNSKAIQASDEMMQQANNLR
ncbi:MAG: flagellar hook-basal body protein [Lachnospiraceae bacterium]|nr:flagellar hook-basal body protein [Lachnospiraceae bacterium]